jgi:hypothetical protein
VDPNGIITTLAGNGDIHISATSHIDELTVRNMLGQLLSITQPRSGFITLHLEEDGMYLVSIKTDPEVITKKVLVKN